MKKNYQVHFYALREVEEKVGKLLNYHARRVIEEVVSLSWDEISKEAADIVDDFYKEAVRNRQMLYMLMKRRIENGRVFHVG